MFVKHDKNTMSILRKWFHKNSVTWRKWARNLMFGKNEENTILRTYVWKKKIIKATHLELMGQASFVEALPLALHKLL
jgi:hypothetical protein